MKKYVKNAVKSALSKPLRGEYRRLLSIGISALLFLSTFLAIIPLTGTDVYAAASKAIVIVNDGVASNITGAQANSVYFGNYYQTNNTNKEPIKWRVLKKNTTDKTLFLLSDQNLDCKQYNEVLTSVTWETCSLRKWLNGLEGYTDNNFIESAFTSGEQGVLVTTVNTNPTTYSQYTSGGTNTNDKVFLLSVPEAQNNSYGFTDDDSRKSLNTAYAITKGANDSSGYGHWWLRSPGLIQYYYFAALVVSYGAVGTNGDSVNAGNVAVRPALNINLSSIIFTSAAEGGKSSVTTGAGALTEPEDYNGSNGWKLTVNDTSRSGFSVTRLGSGKIAAGGNMRFNYSGAKKADNEYVSAILLDENGSLLAYGRIVNTSSLTSGTSYITLPASLVTEGNTYTLQFVSEQCNGDKKTDYSSLPSANAFTFTAGKGTPTAVDFDVTLPTDTTYDGNAKTVTAVAQTGVSGMGDITVKYKDANDIVSTTAPTDPGTYQVLLDVAAGTYYDAANDITADDWTFTITTAGTVATPTFTPAAGTYSTAQNVAISCATEGATIRYTTDGTDPTDTGTIYNGPITVSETKTIKAIAAKAGMADSDVASAEYTIHTHSYIPSVTKEPTCTLAGTRTYTCSCGASYTETIPALGHNYVGTVTKEPTLFTEGIRTYKCSRCDSSYTESIPKLEPSSEEEAKKVEQLLEDLTDENGNLKVEVEVKTEEKEDGTTETTVTIGGQEVVTIITDEDGDETIETNIWTLGGDEVFTYTGTALTPEVHVYDGITRLSEGSDYKVKYGDNVNASEKARVQVSFYGSYKGTEEKTVNFTINPADLTKDVTAESVIVASSNKPKTPVPVITLSNGKVVNDQLMYRYLDSDGNAIKGVKDPGTYTIEAKAKKNNNNFINTLSATITVTGENVKLLSQAKIHFSQKQYTYTGKPVTPGYTLTLDKEPLVEGTDFTVESIKNNTEPGKARITFTAKEGNEKGLVGTASAIFTIAKGRILAPQGDGSDFTYTFEKSVPFAKGGAQPFVTVKDGDYTLVYDRDYTIGYDKSSKKITDKATATVKGKGNYKGSVPVTFSVVRQNISALSSNIIVDDKAESKNGYENPKVTVTDLDGNKLKAGTDFTVSDYGTPDENGIVTAKLTGKGCYEGSIDISYRYIKAAQHLTKIKAAKIANKTYTGREIKLTKKELKKLFYTVDKKSKTTTYLVPGDDFEVVGYTNNTKAGTATVTLRGLNNYGGIRTFKFKIVSAKRSIIDILLGNK